MSTPRPVSPSDSIHLPSSWHADPDDAFHGRITPDGPFKPEKDRYHLYIGLFCPFAHRVNFVHHLKQLENYAGINTSIVRPYAKNKEGWRFNEEDDEAENYKGSTEDKLYGSIFLHQLYFKADPGYRGQYSVPVLWDTELETIVNNESLELLRDLQTAFSSLLPQELAEITLYPTELREDIDRIGDWMQQDLNTGVDKAGFAPTQSVYAQAVPPVFASLNALEKIAHQNGGPYLLGAKMTELDIRAYATLIRFDAVYVVHFKCNLGMIRSSYPVLHNWMKHMYWDHDAFRETTDFRHIKDNQGYNESNFTTNPKSSTPLGPWPNIEEGYEREWWRLRVGGIGMPEVVEYEKTLR